MIFDFDGYGTVVGVSEGRCRMCEGAEHRMVQWRNKANIATVSQRVQCGFVVGIGNVESLWMLKERVEEVELIFQRGTVQALAQAQRSAAPTQQIPNRSVDL